MSSDHSPNPETVTDWLAALRDGDEVAADRIWHRYFGRVCSLAQRRLAGSPRRITDEEDIAQVAMQGLFHGVSEGRFQRLEDRDDLWQILTVITCRRAGNARRTELRRDEVGESAVNPGGLAFAARLEELVSDDVDEKSLDRLLETCTDLIARLEPKLKKVALLKLEGLGKEEIAQRIDRSVKTVERYLRLIRTWWDEP